MNELDYQIKISFAQDGRPYWQMIRKGVVIIPDKEETVLAANATRYILTKIENKIADLS